MVAPLMMAAGIALRYGAQAGARQEGGAPR